MTRFYLIRHATNDLVGRAIAGWSAGVHLNDQGKREAQRLAQDRLDQLFSSPLERARKRPHRWPPA